MEVIKTYALTEKALELGYHKPTTGINNLHFPNHFKACLFSEDQHHYCDGWDVCISSLKWVDNRLQITMLGTERWVDWYASHWLKEGVLELVESK